MPTTVVVVAVSARALAQSAARSHVDVIALDAFGDRDTAAVARCVPVGLDAGVGVSAARVRRALDTLALPVSPSIVIGGGLDRQPSFAATLRRFGNVCANDVDIVRALKDPMLAAECLLAWGWRVPETRLERPADAGGWLRKGIGGAGGVHIHRAETVGTAPRTFHQREIAGVPMSVTFLADGERVRILGINRLLVAPVGNAPFCYAGVISGADLSAPRFAELHDRIARMVQLTALRGLNGLDFVDDGTALWALEVNPRPPASFELYDDLADDGLVAAHIRSFETLPALRPAPPATSRGIAIVYASADTPIDRTLSFPGWCRDIPQPGQTIPPGAPIVSVTASCSTPSEVEDVLKARTAAVRRLLAG